MGAGEAPAKLGAERLGDRRDGNARGVRRGDHAGLEMTGDLPPELPLHVDALEDRLHHPVGLAETVEVVLDVPCRDAVEDGPLVERRGAEVEQAALPRLGGGVPVLLAGQVEEVDGNVEAGGQRRDLRAHRARPKDRDAANPRRACRRLIG